MTCEVAIGKRRLKDYNTLVLNCIHDHEYDYIPMNTIIISGGSCTCMLTIIILYYVSYVLLVYMHMHGARLTTRTDLGPVYYNTCMWFSHQNWPWAIVHVNEVHIYR